MPKKALRGLSGIKVFELLENTETNYKVGEAINIPYAQKLTRDIQTSNDPIYADDEIYDDEEIFDGEDFELEIPEADLKLMSVFEGGNYDEETQEYSWGPDNQSKDYAMTFKAKRKDGNYRMFRYYRAKFKKVKQDLQTQDNGTQVATITISGTFYKRALLSDAKVRVYKDSTSSKDLTWLDTIPTVPETVSDQTEVSDRE
jgi:phi13 family phage major tail protein